MTDNNILGYYLLELYIYHNDDDEEVKTGYIYFRSYNPGRACLSEEISDPVDLAILFDMKYSFRNNTNQKILEYLFLKYKNKNDQS